MKILLICALLSLVSCGNSNKETSNNSTSTSQVQAVDPQIMYNSMAQGETILSIYVSGRRIMQQLEKVSENIRCRKSLSSMIITPAFECWQEIESGDAAQARVQSMPELPYSLVYDQLIGSSHQEKINSERTILCHGSKAVAPGTTYSYTCYKKI